ncbi:MAG: GatB/YqeY domain-containing protein [bacterium]
MSLKEEINQALKTFLKEKKELEVSTLRQLLSSILNKEKEKRFTLSKENPNITEEDSQLVDEEILDVVSLEAKKRREAIEGFEKGGRTESAEKEKKELEILKNYLPEQLSEEEINNLVTEAVNKVGAKEIKDMGKVMAELMPKTKGKADGALVGKIVKEALGQ